MVKIGRRLFCQLTGGGLAFVSSPAILVSASANGNIGAIKTKLDLYEETKGHSLLTKCVGSVSNSKLFRLRGRNGEKFPTAQHGEHVVFCFPKNIPYAFHGYIREPEETAHYVAYLSQERPTVPHIMLVVLESPFANYYLWRDSPTPYTNFQ